MKALWLIVGGFLLQTSVAGAQEALFASGDHCLAYRTHKEMFLMADVEVVGKSCEVSARMEVDGNRVRFTVTSPVASFDSDSSMRDSSVQEILKADEYPDLIFLSRWVPRDEVQAVKQGGTFRLEGELEIAGVPHLMGFSLKVQSAEGYSIITGEQDTSFSLLQIVVPPVAGGVVAQPADDLAILLHLRTDQVLGFDSL